MRASRKWTTTTNKENTATIEPTAVQTIGSTGAG